MTGQSMTLTKCPHAILDQRSRLARPGFRRLVSYGLLAVLIAATGFFVSRNLDGAAAYVRDVSAADLLLLILAGALTVTTVLIFGLVWGGILQRLAGSESGIDFRYLRAFAYSWPGRYLPGTLPYHAARVLMAGRLGTTKRVVAASIGYETVLQLSSAALVGVICLTLALGSSAGAGPLYVVPALLIVPLPVLLRPGILQPLSGWALKRVGRQPLDRAFFLSTGENLRVFMAYCFGHGLNGLGFFLVARALLGPDEISLPLAVAALNLAGLLGVLAFFVPGGIGVREGVIVALLSGSLTPETALLVAGTARAVSIVADVLPFLLLAAFELTQRLLRYTRSRAQRTAAVSLVGRRRA